MIEERVQRSFHVVRIHRLGEMPVETGSLGPLLVLLLSPTGDGHQHQRSPPGFLPEPPHLRRPLLRPRVTVHCSQHVFLGTLVHLGNRRIVFAASQAVKLDREL